MLGVYGECVTAMLAVYGECVTAMLAVYGKCVSTISAMHGQCIKAMLITFFLSQLVSYTLVSLRNQLSCCLPLCVPNDIELNLSDICP